MTRTAVVIWILASPAGALAQGYYGGGTPYANPYSPAPLGAIPTAGALPNYFNRQYQPLSPYLNLTGNGNPAVNYYYGVRPSQMAGGQLQGGAPLGIAAGMGYRTGFIPALQQVPPGEPPVVEQLPGAVPGFAPIGPASFGVGLTRFNGVYGGGGGLSGGRIPNQGLAPLRQQQQQQQSRNSRPSTPRR